MNTRNSRRSGKAMRAVDAAISSPTSTHATSVTLLTVRWATDGLGYQVFNVANADTSVGMPSAAVIAEFYPDVCRTRELGEFETFYSIAKARDLLGFHPESRWRKTH